MHEFIIIALKKLKNSELNRKTIEEFKNSKKNPFVVVLDNIRSLNNIGSVFRTSDALSVEAIYLCGISAIPPHKDIHKTALGATESVDWKYFDSTQKAIEILQKDGYKIVAVEQTNDSLCLLDYKLNINSRIALVFGNEVKGVDQAIIDICDECLEIPQYGTKHSFNISVSVGIILWDLNKKYIKNTK